MKRVLIGIPLVLLFMLAAVIATRPDHFAVVRSVPITAAPATAHDVLSALHTWPVWSHWGKTDRIPGSDLLEGPPFGVGAKWSWQKKDKGDRMGLELVRDEPTRVVFRITGNSPAKPTLTFTIEPGKVTASFEGELELMGKAVSIVKGPEAVVGPSLERELGLLAKHLASR